MAPASGSTAVQATSTSPGTLITTMTSGSTTTLAHPVINEVLPMDRGGKGWVEFFNPGQQELDLSGYTVSFVPRRDGAAPLIWEVPALKVEAQGYRVFDTTSDALPLTVGTGALEVRAPGGQVVQQEAWEFWQIAYDMSVGRWPDGQGNFMALRPVTPDERNARPLAQACGDGTILPLEECDGYLLGGFCTSIGYASGSIGCTPTCRYIRTACEPEVSTIRLNEVDVAGRKVELVNIGSSAVSLSSWQLSSYQWPQVLERDLAATAVPRRLVLAPGGFGVVDLSFVLFGQGGVGLHTPTGKLADFVEYGPGGEEVFYCRDKDGTGTWHRCEGGTLGNSNTR